MAMGTVPCLLWKWWTWCVVLREEETRAATAGHGNTSNASESTSLNSKAGLAHTTGDAATCLGTICNPLSTSTSTSCSMGAGPEKKESTAEPLQRLLSKVENRWEAVSRRFDEAPTQKAATAGLLRQSDGDAAAAASAFAVKFMLIESEAAATSTSFLLAQFSNLLFLRSSQPGPPPTFFPPQTAYS
ncbi:hypothetical protein CRENBAI_023827 [Crenichthys baileyi]|uniref:Uncharacterized protein n=1 Tax=Crenichthys baileyi TaxID=28760 RepID=A0AAV9S2W6_9TELE